MTLLILTTGNSFTPSMLYKENYLIKAALECGHEVVVFANQYTYINGRETIIKNTEKVKDYELKRFPYKNLAFSVLTRKIRWISGLEKEIIKAHPDLLFINCAQVYNVQFLGQVKKSLPNVKIVMDFSTKYLNSAGNWLSKNILHHMIYRIWIKKALPYVDRIFYISAESRDFAREMYDIPLEIMEHNNLPGKTIPRATKEQYKREISDRLMLNGNILLLYSGKIYPEKKIDKLVRAFSSVDSYTIKLLIIGSYTCNIDYKEEVEKLIEMDDRILFMDFVSGEELTKYVCACDLYIQPGSISQTCQTAVCCGTPLCFNDIPTHREIYNGNGFFADGEEELTNVIRTIDENPTVLTKMSDLSYKMAEEELDYKIIYNKILRSVGLA